MNQTEKKEKVTAVDKTERMLKNFNRILKSIRFVKKQKADLEKEKKAIEKTVVKSSRVALRDGDNTYHYTDEALNSKINELNQLIIKSESEISFMRNCFKELEQDEYFGVIEMFYGLEEDGTDEEQYKRKTVEEIADFYGKSTKTIYEHKTRLLDEVSYLLIPLDKIAEFKEIG